MSEGSKLFYLKGSAFEHLLPPLPRILSPLLVLPQLKLGNSVFLTPFSMGGPCKLKYRREEQRMIFLLSLFDTSRVHHCCLFSVFSYLKSKKTSLACSHSQTTDKMFLLLKFPVPYIRLCIMVLRGY